MRYIGRYKPCSWKEDYFLCENRKIAEKELENTLTKLCNDGLLNEYEKLFDEWLQEGIIEKVPTEEVNYSGYHLSRRHTVKKKYSYMISF